MKRYGIFFIISFVLSLLFYNYAFTKTIILEGKLDSRIKVTQQIGFSVDRPLSKLSFRFALPASFSNRGVLQNLQGLDIRFDPQPVKVDDEADSFGNRFKTVTWNNLNKNARVSINFETRIKSELPAMESRATFPLQSIPQN